MKTTHDPDVIIISDNHIMNGSARSPLRRVLEAPFTPRAWAELAYTVVSAFLAVGALIFIVPTLVSGPMWALSAPRVRKLGAGSRHLARRLLGEEVLAPPPRQPALNFLVPTPDGARLAILANAAGGTARVWDSQRGVTIRKLPPERIAGLAAEASLAIEEIKPFKAVLRYLATWILDPVAWRTRAYFAIKAPLADVGLAVAAACWLGGLYLLAFPASAWAAHCRSSRPGRPRSWPRRG